MNVEILGSAGAMTTPRPCCACRVCVEARARGTPYARTGPSVFVHGPDLLVDTPEESKWQLNRAGIERIAACVYSHWHPDHVMGRRVWESLNADWRSWPRRTRGRTPIYLPERVAADFRTFLGSWDHLAFMSEAGWVDVVELADGETIELAGAEIHALPVAHDYVYAFLLEEQGRRLLIAPDELQGWDPPAGVRGVNLAILPMGICEHDPFTGERRIHADHPVLQLEATFAETLGIVRRLEAEHTVLTHIEESDELGYDDLLRLEQLLRGDGLEVTFAYDGLRLEV